MRRRDFITLLGAAAAAWPFAAQAQQAERLRRVGVLLGRSEDLQNQLRIEAFVRRLRQLGWIEGRNVQFDYRWGAAESDRTRWSAEELVALAPDVILTSGSATLGPLLQASRTVPIVFATVPDPVGAGFVDSLARPGGNATGFTIFEYSISGKSLELLKEIAPSMSRVAFLREAGIAAASGQFGALQTAAPSLGIEVSPINVRDTSELERALVSFARLPNSGLVVAGSTNVAAHRNLIINFAARHKVPAVYFDRYFVTDGGLLSYGPNLLDNYPRAAEYVDRILKGEKPADLPVQAPTKYELVINLKTAKALGLEVPPTLLARADEVIE
jgi:putative tryptophan/tyrosine transport system substrate-binding protein